MSRKTTADRWAVISWHKEGLTVADISRKTGFDRRFISRWIKKFENIADSADVEEGSRTGRPRKRTPSVEKAVEKKNARKTTTLEPSNRTATKATKDC